MQKAVHQTVDEKRVMTKDMAIVLHRDTAIHEGKDYIDMQGFITEVLKSYKQQIGDKTEQKEGK